MAAQIEAILDNLKAKLVSDLAAKITTINAENTDDYDIVAPVEIFISTRSELHNYPTVMILPDASTPNADLGQRVLWGHRIRIVSWLSDPLEESLARKLLRFQRAVRETAMSSRSPGSGTASGYAIALERDEYGPVFSEEGDGVFVQGASSLFNVSQQQDI